MNDGDGRFLQALAAFKAPVWRRLRALLPERFPSEHYRIVAEYPRRQGKYLRPSLILLATELFGGRRVMALDTAVAMQLSEEWLLVHDDVEDHSWLRRKGATLNAAYGNEVAINAGDALHVLMWKAVGQAMKGLNSRIAWQVHEKMNDILLKTIEGQFLELDWRRRDIFSMKEEEYFRMVYRKSGYYTITGPLQLGAIVAGASPAELTRIAQWGMPFGCAFQLRDDILGVIPSKSGKDDMGDITEGKRTLILIHLLKNAPSIVTKKIIAIYRKTPEAKSYAEKCYVRKMMMLHGSIAYAQSKAEQLAITAEKNFIRTTARLPAEDIKMILREGMCFAVERQH